jgi:hypothetical protein
LKALELNIISVEALICLGGEDVRKEMWIGVVVLILGVIAPLQAGEIVPGTAMIWGAGHSGVPDSGATLPPFISFTPGSVLSISFPNITGTVQFGGVAGPTNGPEGLSMDGWTGTNINGYSGISGIRFDGRQMFLVGLFLGPDETTGTGPAKLAYGSGPGLVGPDNATFNPLLAQVFFVGDGRGGGSAQQTFNVPTGASRLFFGFADGVPEFGAPSGPVNPGAYGDNLGSLNVTYSLNEVNLPLVANPEPSSIVLMGLGVAALALLRRRRA